DRCWVVPRILRIAESGNVSGSEVVVGTNVFLPIVQVRARKRLPVLAVRGSGRRRTLSGWRRRAVEIRQWILTHLVNECLKRCRDDVWVRTLHRYWEWLGDRVTA